MLTSEDALVQRLPKRDARAMTLFYQPLSMPSYAAVLRILRNRQSAEDVVQEGMLKGW